MLTIAILQDKFCGTYVLFLFIVPISFGTTPIFHGVNNAPTLWYIYLYPDIHAICPPWTWYILHLLNRAVARGGGGGLGGLSPPPLWAGRSTLGVKFYV